MIKDIQHNPTCSCGICDCDGGQFFSKSLLGFTTYKLELAGREGLMGAAIIMILPFIILAVLIYLLPPWEKSEKRENVGTPVPGIRRFSA